MADPQISVVVATRNRARELGRLLRVIQEQSLEDFECIVVDDASSPETVERYDELWQGLDDRFRLTRRPHPGGPSLARNTGIALAKGRYIALCDDDDYWTRQDHLAVAVRALDSQGADLFFSNMRTSREGDLIDPDWFGLLGILPSGTETPIGGETDIYRIERRDVARFLRHRIFHANTLVVARDLFTRLGAYWEKISFCEDLDLAFRLADAAGGILYRTTVTADLDVGPHVSVARSFQEQDRVLFGLLAALRAETLIADAGLRKVARANRAWRLLELAHFAAGEGRTGTARELTMQSLLLAPPGGA